jgi:HEPN domain-containing protein
MSIPEQSLTMQIMASKDIGVLKFIVTEKGIDDSIFGFHAQQAAEKSLKAWIVAAGGTYGFTHDLERLLLELEQLGCDVATFEDLTELSAFEVQFRYEAMDFEEPQIDRADILRKVLVLYEHVQSLLAIEEART